MSRGLGDVYKRQYQSFTKEVKGAGTILEGLSADEAVKAIMDKLEAKFII